MEEINKTFPSLELPEGGASEDKQQENIDAINNISSIVAKDSTLLGQSTLLSDIINLLLDVSTATNQSTTNSTLNDINSKVSTQEKQEDLISAIQFADDGYGERYMREVQDFQASAVGYYGISVVRLKAGQTRDVFIQHLSVENENTDDFQLIIFEYDRDDVPSVLDNASISFNDMGESCQYSVITQTGGANDSGIINTFGERKDGLWLSRANRSGDLNPKIKINPNKEYLIAVETLTTGSDIYASTTILEKPL